MTRRFATVLVVAAIILAGCSGGPVTTTTPDSEPTESPDGTTTGDSLNRVTVPSELVPPGANERSIVNPRQLVTAHRGALQETPHRSAATFTDLGSDTPGTVDYELRVGSDGYHLNRTKRTGEDTTSLGVYRSGDVTRVRNVTETDTTYEYASGPTRTSISYARPQRPIGQIVLFYDSMVGRLQATDFATINGQKVVKYQSSGMNATRFQQIRDVLGVPNGTLEDVSMELYVDRNGVIHDLDASMTVTTGEGEERTFDATHRLDGYNATSITEPDWASSVAALNGSVSEDARLVELENTGSEPIGNFTMGLAGNVTAEETVERTISPGETVFAYVTTEGNDTTLHVSETRPDVPADAATLPRRNVVRVFVETDTTQLSVGIILEEENSSSMSGFQGAVESHRLASASTTETVTTLVDRSSSLIGGANSRYWTARLA